MEDINEIDDYMKKLTREKTEILEKRNKERQQNLETKHELTKRNAAENEDHEFFQTKFREQIKDIENTLMNLKPGDREQLTTKFNEILSNVQNLQNYLTTSTLFLSHYNVKACQTAINELKQKVEIAKEKLLTKKKFGFRAKVTTVPTTKPESLATVISKPVCPPSNVNHINWTIQNKENQAFYLEDDEVNEKDVTISSLKNCVVRIKGYPGSLQLSHLTNCIVLSGPVSRAVFVDKCINCKFAFGCQQLRLHTSNYCDIYMHVTCRAIIEDCKSINVAPYNYKYENIDDDFVRAGLDLHKNHWDNVADFNWLSTDVNSPNWQKMDFAKRINDWDKYLEKFLANYSVT